MAAPRRRLKAVESISSGSPEPHTVPLPNQPWPVEGLPSDVIELLTQRLDPKLIARRRGPRGLPVKYLEGFRAIDQANRIFGYDGWGSELVGPVTCRELAQPGAKRGQSSTVALYSASVRVLVRGCPPKSDLGCAAIADDTIEAHETALKAAVTDGLKRALRQFGDQFANRLYERPSAARSAEATEINDLRVTALLLGGQLGLDEAGTRQRVASRAQHAFDELETAELARVLRAMASALTKRAA